MRPPICAICGKRISEKNLRKGSAGLLYFKKTREGKAFDERMKRKGFVGHPPYAEWFCEEHYSLARTLVHLSLRDAMRELQSVFLKE